MHFFFVSGLMNKDTLSLFLAIASQQVTLQATRQPLLNAPTSSVNNLQIFIYFALFSIKFYITLVAFLHNIVHILSGNLLSISFIKSHTKCVQELFRALRSAMSSNSRSFIFSTKFNTFNTFSPLLFMIHQPFPNDSVFH